MKETYEIGRANEAGNPQPWPDKLDKDGAAFRSTMQDFFSKCKEMHVVLMRGIAMGMGLDVYFFDPFLDAGDNNLLILAFASDYTRWRFPFVALGFLFTFLGMIVYVGIDVKSQLHVAYFATFMMTWYVPCLISSLPHYTADTLQGNVCTFGPSRRVVQQ